MKKNPAYSVIEPLEQRIAPALLVYGANLLGGSGNPSVGESSLGQNNTVTVKVLSGQAIVWYDGFNITGISVGPNVTLDITGDVGPDGHGGVVGSIVANLDANGRLTDSDHNPANGDDGLLILPNNILGITTHPLSGERGGVFDIVTGGSVSNVTINGDLHGIYAGDAYFQNGSTAANPINVGLPVNPVDPSSPYGFTFSKTLNSFNAGSGAFQSGASISDVTIQYAVGLQIFSGNGYASGSIGGDGGDIQGVKIFHTKTEQNYTGPTYVIKAGDGASSSVGGAGGSISKVQELSSTGVASLQAGNGGNGSAGAGGAGGSITNLDLQASQTAYTARAGNGGSGAPAGAGGNVSFANFSGNTPASGILVSAPFTHALNLSNPPENDVLAVDSSTGTMVLMQNGGNGVSFSAVLQDDRTTPDTSDDLYTIGSKASNPTSAIAADVNGDGYMDIVVGYADGTIGIYENTPSQPGVFVKQIISNGVYSGDQLTGSTLHVKDSPIVQLVAGNFGGTGADLAVISNGSSPNKTVLSILNNLTAPGTTFDKGVTYSTPTTTTVNGVGTALALESSSGGTDHVVIGFADGRLDSYTQAGVLTSEVALAGGITGMDSDPQAHRVLALTKAGTLGVYNYDSNGALSLLASGPDLSLQPGKAIVAHFINDPSASEDSIAVLSSVGTGSRMDIYSVHGGLFSLGTSINSTVPLKNFAVSYEAAGVHGIAALPGALGHFEYSFSDSAFQDFALPLLQTGKQVLLYGGNGGDGIDPISMPKLVGKGGAGGNITAINAQAVNVLLQAGNGGNSATGPAGAGGSVTNPTTMTTLSGTVLTPSVIADGVGVLIPILVQSGNGGSPGGASPGPQASGGNGGIISGLVLQVNTGDAELDSGNGGNGNGGNAGNGGNILNVNTHLLGGNLRVTLGNGGFAASGKTAKGGSGGSLSGLTHWLDLQNEPDGTDIVEVPYNVTLTAGTGGNSTNGPAGAGGSISTVNLTVDPTNETYNSLKKHTDALIVDHHIDSTVRVVVQAGDGGTGAVGGAGGGITALKSKTIFDQVDLDNGGLILNPMVLSLASGNGGVGTAGAGGNGGSINLGANNPLLGVSHFDEDAAYYFTSNSTVTTPGLPIEVPPLLIVSGHGGDGATKGGNGGAISSVYSANALFADGSIIVGQELDRARVVSGDGGKGGISDGGAGGTISNLSIGAGSLQVTSGHGGDGGTILGALTAKGGAGGGITGATLGSVLAGVNLKTGAGGKGITAGGAGGAIANIQFNGGQQSYDTNLVAGNGGDATALKAKAGNGGSITGITQSKDLNSSISLIQAGNGGSNPAGFGGIGGSVKQIAETGFIGAPGFGAFLDPGTHLKPQGLFVGRGGSGATPGSAGSVVNVKARQISAIGAAVDYNTGLFGVAASISGVTADLIGFDVNSNNSYNDSQGGGSTPTAVVALDGFLLAKVFSNINTFNPARTTAFEFTA